MPHQRLPSIDSPVKKTASTASSPFDSCAPQRHHQTCRRKHPANPRASVPSSVLFSDSSVTAWRGLAHEESSFSLIPSVLPSSQPLLCSPAPPTGRQQTLMAPPEKNEEDDEASSSSFSSEILSSCRVVPQLKGGVSRRLRSKKRVLPQHCSPQTPRLPPLRPITNLSFSRSYTFSFFELPLHHSPHCRAERIRNLIQVLKQIRF